MTEWKTYRLEDICDYVTSRTSRIENYISTENMLPNKGGVCAPSNEPSGTAIEYKVGDILISNIRPYFQKIWQADCNGACSADVLCIRANNQADSKYLYYLLSQQLFFDYVMAGAKGCKMPRGDKKQIMQWQISVPPLEEQRRIAGILGAIDDKIENNRRINTNLELQAQALFEEWCESCSKTITIKELADNVLDYTPNANSKVVLLNSSDVTQGLFAELPLVDNVNLKGQFKKRFQKDDILYSEIRPRNKHYAYCYFDSDRYIASTRLIVLRGKKEKIVSNTLLYQYLISQTVFEEFTLKTETRSGTFPQGNYQDLSSIVVPYSDNQKEIAGSLDVIYEEIWSNYKENETLATLRDTLLPKLMNGEIKTE